MSFPAHRHANRDPHLPRLCPVRPSRTLKRGSRRPPARRLPEVAHAVRAAGRSQLRPSTSVGACATKQRSISALWTVSARRSSAVKRPALSRTSSFCWATATAGSHCHFAFRRANSKPTPVAGDWYRLDKTRYFQSTYYSQRTGRFTDPNVWRTLEDELRFLEAGARRRNRPGITRHSAEQVHGLGQVAGRTFGWAGPDERSRQSCATGSSARDQRH